MLYLGTPSSPEIRQAMRDGLIGCMTTPKQGNVIPEGAHWAADNGKFGKGWPGESAWFDWLTRTVDRYGADRCLWAVAPDQPPYDGIDLDRLAELTLAESLPWLPRIRGLGIPAAFACQNGSEQPGMIPWDEIDVVFLAGDTEWKTGPLAAQVADEARRRGKRVHMGRVNSEDRFRRAVAFGCDTADGTYLTFGPDTNLPRLLSWCDGLLRRQPPHVQFTLLDELTLREVPA